MPSPKQAHLDNLTKLYTVFSSNQSYQQQHHSYKTSIIEHNHPIILSVAITISNILHDDEIDPYAKLLAMRFLRECWSCAGYAFMTLVHSMLRDILLQVAMFRKASNQQDRGQQLFINWKSAKYDEIYLRRVGLSFHKIVLQMYEALAQVIPSCPYNPTQYPIPSAFSSHYKLLKQLQVGFPNSKTYYKSNYITKISQHYRSQQPVQPKYIPSFYQYLLEQLCQPDLYKQVKYVYLSIIESGDQYCVKYAIEYVRDMMDVHMVEGGQSRMDYVDFVDGMVRMGDVQAVWAVETELLCRLLSGYRRNVVKQEQLMRVAAWGGIMTKVGDNLFDYDAYAAITQQIGRAKDKDPNPDILQQYTNQLTKMKPHNIIKLKYLVKNRSVVESIKQLLRLINKQNHVSIYKISISKQLELASQRKEQKLLTPISKIQIQQQVPSNIKQVKQVKQEKVQQLGNQLTFHKEPHPTQQVIGKKSIIIELIPQKQQFSQYPTTPKPKISTRFLHSTHKKYTSLRQSQKSNQNQQQSQYQYQSIPNSNFITPKNTHNPNSPLTFKSINTTENKKLRKSSFDSYSIMNAHVVSKEDINTSAKKVGNQQYYGYVGGGALEDLKKEIKERMEKEKLLEMELKKKDELIRKLTVQNSQKSLPSSSNLNQSKRLSFELNSQNSKIAQEHSRKTSTFHILPSQQLSSSADLYKWKKHLLKKKVLVLQNSTLEIGLITIMNNNIMQCSFFCTAFVNLQNFTAKINCNNSWLENTTNRIEYKDKINTQTQYIIKINLICNYRTHGSMGINEKKPQLEISYKNQKTNQTTISQRVELPISINKLCENIQINPEEYRNLYSSKSIEKDKKIEYSELIPIDYRICRNFDSFLKYFPHAIKKDQSKTFVALLECFKGKFYLEVKIIKKNEAVLRFLLKQEKETDLKFIEEVFQVYKELLSI